MDWLNMAACRGLDPDAFFIPVDDGVDVPAVEAIRKVCHDCPVRKACFAEVMADERGNEAVERWGVRAYLSPGQRESVEKRGITRCPGCDSLRDPVLLAKGLLKCPRNCGVAERTTIPPPHSGDLWTKRHTTLSKRIVGWLVDSVNPGDEVPNPTRMSDMMGGVRRSDVSRVYRELVADGTLVHDLRTYTRGSKIGLDRTTWKPRHLLDAQEA